MERSNDAVERRTELALREIALRGLLTERTLSKCMTPQSVRRPPSSEPKSSNRPLRDWTAVSGDVAGGQLVRRAQCVIGLINVNGPREGRWGQAMIELSQVKRDWMVVKP